LAPDEVPTSRGRHERTGDNAGIHANRATTERSAIGTAAGDPSRPSFERVADVGRTLAMSPGRSLASFVRQRREQRRIAGGVAGGSALQSGSLRNDASQDVGDIVA
jgi:hypothetical protein